MRGLMRSGCRAFWLILQGEEHGLDKQLADTRIGNSSRLSQALPRRQQASRNMMTSLRVCPTRPAPNRLRSASRKLRN